MKILILNSFYAPDIGGGAEWSLMVLAENLKKVGHEVVVVCLTESAVTSREFVNGIPVWRTPLRNLYWHLPRKKHSRAVRKLWHLRDVINFSMGRALRKILKIEAPDVASVHNLSGWSVAAWNALRAENIPIVQVLHDQYLICPLTSAFRANQICKQQCFDCAMLRMPHARMSGTVDGVIGVSQYILEEHVSRGYFPNAVKTAIHDVRSEDLRVQARSRPSKGSGARVFGFIGSIAPNKGIENLLRVFNSLSFADSTLVIAGTGAESYAVPLRRQYESEKIIFLGQVPAAEFFNRVDAVIVPSLWNEPLGCVVFESFIFGRPVIASRRGGIPEMVVDGENGLLVEPTSDEDVSSALTKLHDDPGLMDKLSKGAESHSYSYTDFDLWVGKYEGMYRDAITRHQLIISLEDQNRG